MTVLTQSIAHCQLPGALAKPEPRVPGGIAIRVATMADLAFIDGLHKLHSKMVGWMPTTQLESYIARGQVLIAECHSREGGNPDCGESTQRPLDARLRGHDGGPVTPVGYIIASDRYFKRDDCGIIYQLNVAPGNQRKLIGATLVKAVFERAAYGCKLFCCWCAQDLEANYFWESLGFVPLAFRTGSRAKQRIHIFWQRRINNCSSEALTSAALTPYWFPSHTSAGAVREDRIVLPIPPGTHWRDAKPMVLPGGSALLEGVLEGSAAKAKRERRPKPPAIKPTSIAMGGLRPLALGGGEPRKTAGQPAKPERHNRKHKNDPKFIAAARELRDRYLEQINWDRLLPAAQGKYDVSRQLEAAPTTLKQTPLLKAA